MKRLLFIISFIVLTIGLSAQSLSNSIGYQDVTAKLRVADTNLVVERNVSAMMTFNYPETITLTTVDKGYAETIDFRIKSIKRLSEWRYLIVLNHGSRLIVDAYSTYKFIIPIRDNCVYDRLTITFRK